ncbi:potassium-transporting ATPase subunit C [Actinomadura luteofluorescens]
MSYPTWVRQHLAALRALLVLTVVCGVAYPLAVFAVAQVPGLRSRADGSTVSLHGRTVGSALIGQSFTGKNGAPLRQYFQSRPSEAGNGYDPTSTAASNLGPEDIVDTLPGPKAATAGESGGQSLLTRVCSRSKAVGDLEGVSGARPFCTPGGVGAVLAVFGRRAADGTVPHPTGVVSLNEEQGVVQAPFIATYKGVPVRLARPGEDYSAAWWSPSGAALPPILSSRPTRSPRRQRPGPAHLARLRRPPDRPGRQGPRRRPRPGEATGRGRHRRPRPRLHGRAAGQRPEGEHRPGPEVPGPRLTR